MWDTQRRTIAMAMSFIVVVLLGLTMAPNSNGYSYRPSQSGSIQWDQIPSVTQRIRLLLDRTTTSSSSDRVPMMHDGQPASVPVTVKAISRTRHVALLLAATVFALLGLFVLWWGRDRASLWLGLFCASFATPLLNPYGILPEWAMLVLWIVQSLLAVLSILSLYALAETVACAALQSATATRIVISIRFMVVVLVAGSLIYDFGSMFLPILFGIPMPAEIGPFSAVWETTTIIFGFVVAPLAVLSAAVAGSSGQQRIKPAIILATTALALIGPIVSIIESLKAHHPPGYDTWWFTLLIIPLGFAITIPTLRVVDVRFFINRLLVLTSMSVVLALFITGLETFLKRKVETNASSASLDPLAQFLIAFVIVLFFNTLDRWFGERFKELLFHRETEAVKALRRFAHKAPFYKYRDTLLDDAVAEIRFAIRTSAVAIYREDIGCYKLLRKSEGSPFADTVSFDDGAFLDLRAHSARVDLTKVSPRNSAAGAAGFAFPIAVVGHVVGALVVGPRLDENESQYVGEELDALDEVAQKVGDGLFQMRANEIAGFVRTLAAGDVKDGAVVDQARELQDQGLLGSLQ